MSVHMSIYRYLSVVMCTVYSKTFFGKAFTVRVENGYSQDNFLGSIL